MNGYWHCSMAANMTKREATRHFRLPDRRLNHPLIKYSWGKNPDSDQASLDSTTNLRHREEHVKR